MTPDPPPVQLADCTECYAIPGSNSLIDVIRPDTDRTWHFHHTAAEVAAREPFAQRMTVAAWRDAKAARQHTPITWRRTTEGEYRKMLDVLPPAAWIGGAFLVGEPYDHDALTGAPRYTAYWQQGYAYRVASRPLTVQELRTEIGR